MLCLSRYNEAVDELEDSQIPVESAPGMSSGYLYQTGYYFHLPKPRHSLSIFTMFVRGLQSGPRTLAVMVGNSRALWNHLLEVFISNPGLLATQDPVDEYTERAIAAAAPSKQYAGCHCLSATQPRIHNFVCCLLSLCHGRTRTARTQLSSHPAYILPAGSKGAYFLPTRKQQASLVEDMLQCSDWRR